MSTSLKNARARIQTLPSDDSIFVQLRSENIVSLSDEDYDRLWEVMQELGRRKGKKYLDFRSREQGLITLRFLKGQNVFGVIPTSGGKSFTFQTVAQMTDGLTVVISPLIALMKDMVWVDKDWFYSKGKKNQDWTYFNSDLSPQEKRKVKNRIRAGTVKLLYISPERLKSADFNDLLKACKKRVRRFVIDEAHCILGWGENFRVSYLHIGKEIQKLQKELTKGQKIHVLLLTATATPELQYATVKNLGIHIEPENFITQLKDADRSELRIRLHKVSSDKQKISWLVKQLKRGGCFYNKRGIIFSAFAKGGEGLGAYNAEMIAEELKQNHIKRARCYHGQMDAKSRSEVQEAFKSDELRVLVATKAFGMGVDLSNLDFIVHFYPPLSLEDYWQEAGRGGRGKDASKGEYCDCIVLYDSSDYRNSLDYSVLKSFTSVTGFEKVLCTFTSVAKGEWCFNASDPSNTWYVKPHGQLRQVLKELRTRKDIKKLDYIEIAGVELERWKLLRRPRTVVSHIDKWLGENEKDAFKQTRRLRDILQLRADSKGRIIRVASQFPWLVRELNWFTYPEIGALEMIDNQWENDILYTRFEVVNNKPSRQSVKELARRLRRHSTIRRAKLKFVFNRFLKAKSSKEAKSIILEYLNLEQEPGQESALIAKSERRIKTRSMNFKEDIKKRNYHAWVLLNENGDKAFVIPIQKGYAVVNNRGGVIIKARTIREAMDEIASRSEF